MTCWRFEAPAGHGAGHLRGIAPMLPAIAPAVDRFADRSEALAARGSMWATAGPSRPAMAAPRWNTTTASSSASTPTARLAAVASGGRYDALTAVLGRGRSIPAVGGMIRPGRWWRTKGGLMTLKIGRAVQGAADGGDLRLVRRARRDDAAHVGRRPRICRRGRGVEGVDLVLLSAGEIPRELAAGRIHLGVTGTDLVRDKLADCRRRWWRWRRWASAMPT
jgi:hypothetical protein